MPSLYRRIWIEPLAALFSLSGLSVKSASNNTLLGVIRRAKQAIVDDWRGTRFLFFGLALLLVSVLAVTLYYLNHPQADISADTPGYLTVTQHILTKGDPVDAMRTPGYPLMIALVFLVAGTGHLFAVSVFQAFLFVLATLEIYTIACIVFRRAWVALAVGLLVGTNTYFMGIAKSIMIEGFTLWLVVTLALALIVFLYHTRVRNVWLIAILTLVLFMTRPEWVYLPVPLCLYLLFVAARRGKLRRLLPHAVAAVLVLYAVLGLFIYQNGKENGYAGITFVQRLNLLGKIIQYRMQDEADPQYAVIVRGADQLIASGGWSPAQLKDYYPPIAANNWALGDAYATSIVVHHPVEFVIDTLPVMLSSMNEINTFSFISPRGPFLGPLLRLYSVSTIVYHTYQFFPFFALFWAILLFWRRTRHLRWVEAMGAVLGLILYDLTMTSLGGYTEYWRLHVPFDPLLILVIWGTLLAGVAWLVERALTLPMLSWRTVGWAWGLLLMGAVAGCLLVTLVMQGPGSLAHPGAWLITRWVLAHSARVLALLSVPILLTVLNYTLWRRVCAASSARGSSEQEASSQDSRVLVGLFPQQREERIESIGEDGKLLRASTGVSYRVLDGVPEENRPEEHTTYLGGE